MLLHTPLWQSVGAPQALLSAHLGQVGPPQSTSLSSLSSSPSLHVARHVHPEQLPPMQSVPAPHPLPVGHLGQLGPPQSLSVSAPFFTPSVHTGTWHFW